LTISPASVSVAMLSVTIHGPLSENSSYTKHKPITVVVSIDVKIKEPFFRGVAHGRPD
jgi:hypothetical protein